MLGFELFATDLTSLPVLCRWMDVSNVLFEVRVVAVFFPTLWTHWFIGWGRSTVSAGTRTSVQQPTSTTAASACAWNPTRITSLQVHFTILAHTLKHCHNTTPLYISGLLIFALEIFHKKFCLSLFLLF